LSVAAEVGWRPRLQPTAARSRRRNYRQTIRNEWAGEQPCAVWDFFRVPRFFNELQGGKFPPFREFADRRSADRSVRVLAMAGFSTQRDLLSTIACVPFVRKINVIFLKTGERHLREMCLKIGHLRNGGSPRPKINHADMLYTLTPNI
jgi:hypothetical protein